MSNNHDVVKEKLNEVFQDVFDDEELQIHENMTANDIEGWDSLMHITLVISVEKKFGIELNTAEVGQFENVGGMIDLLIERVGSAA